MFSSVILVVPLDDEIKRGQNMRLKRGWVMMVRLFSDDEWDGKIKEAYSVVVV